ncbi:MAG: Lrp/AsnC family transcriptional regulator [Candidatus Baldrarchaeia archaeon]
MRILQRDGRTPFTDVAKKCKVSTDAIIRRFNKMKKMGIISGTTVYLILKNLDINI